MRTLLIATVTTMLAGLTGPAAAQRLGMQPGAGYPQPGIGAPAGPQPAPAYRDGDGAERGQATRARTRRWDERDGRWSAGYQAPGGWNAYRRPYRGYRLNSYWNQPSFYLNDYATFGLAQPAPGYSWTRYYDDAVMIDHDGQVYDMASGIDWHRADRGGYDQGGYGQGGYDQRGYNQGGYDQRGYAPVFGPSREIVQPLPRGPMRCGPGCSTWSTGGVYGTSGVTVNGGYVLPGASTTVVTITSAPVVTTTTTEYVEERVVAHRIAHRTVYRARHVWHPRPHRRPLPRCLCGS